MQACGRCCKNTTANLNGAKNDKKRSYNRKMRHYPTLEQNFATCNTFLLLLIWSTIPKALDNSVDNHYNPSIELRKTQKMSIESLMLDTGMDPMITDFEKQCYGMSEADIRDQYMNSITAKFSGQEMVVMSILSDCQELLTFGSDTKEQVRKQLNVAKFILSEMMDAKEVA